ncbi:MAG: metallophosphoesterase [Treponema sp.]|jgi:hypothetical protein|nr:metallophosphoesterase [Treponema sp.]
MDEQGTSNGSGLSRRDFLKTAAAGAVGAAVVSVLGACATPVWNADENFLLEDYLTLVKKTGEDFRILQLADTQLNGIKKEMQRTFEIISRAIAKTRPHLLVLTGDNVEGLNNRDWGRRLIEFLDGFGIPYAMVMGNHDGEGIYDNSKMGEIYGSGAYSLFRPGLPSIHGTGNYVVNITGEAGDVLYALAMIDSNRYRLGGKGYDYIYPDQIAWYKWYIEELSAAQYGPESGRMVKSMAFFHIPLPEVNDVRDLLKVQDPVAEAYAYWETPSPPAQNTGMFQQMLALGSTTHLFFGHDHLNLLDYGYQGIHFVYGLKTGPCSYYNEKRQGTTLITVRDDLSVGVEFLFD